MRIFQGAAGLSPDRFRSPVMTIGTFDGLHAGHAAVIGETVECAAALDRESLVLTFSTHPREVVCGHRPRTILPLHERLALMSGLSVETAVVLDFTQDLADTEPEDFARRVVLGALGASTVILGHNARFGKARRGDAGLLRAVGREAGLEVRQCPPVLLDGHPVSSSAVRKAIVEGNLDLAAAMLGRPVTLMGEVVRGRGLGSKIGFPTANLRLSHDVKPPEGVWRGRISLADRTYPCVISIGRTPTFGEGLPELVEVHVAGFEGALLGADLKVEVTGRIREQIKFADAAALTAAIADDVARAAALFKEEPAGTGKSAPACRECKAAGPAR